MFEPPHGIWTDELANEHPVDAIAWATKCRKIWKERSYNNSMMDSGWSESTAIACSSRLADCDRIELAAMRTWTIKLIKVTQGLINALDGSQLSYSATQDLIQFMTECNLEGK